MQPINPQAMMPPLFPQDVLPAIVFERPEAPSPPVPPADSFRPPYLQEAQTPQLGQGMPATHANYGMPQWLPAGTPAMATPPGMRPMRLAMTPTSDQRLRRVDGDIEALTRRIEELERQMSRGGGGGNNDRDRPKISMKDRKAYPGVKQLDTTPKGMELWVCGFRDFLRCEDGFEGYFDWCHRLEQPPTPEQVQGLAARYANIFWFDNQLYSLLCGLCVDEEAAMSILLNRETDTGHRGALACNKIVQHVKGKGTVRVEELRKAVITEPPVAAGRRRL